MNTRNISCISLTAASFVLLSGLSGCGFKSDLFLPKAEDPLFKPDSQPTLEEVVPPFLPSADAEIVEGTPIPLDNVTAEAIDGQILVSPGAEAETPTDGVLVDITDLERDLERERNK